MVTILGLAVNHHDSSLALVKDGSLCEIVEVERLSRVKKIRAKELLPYGMDLLRRHGVAVSDLDAVATCLHGGLPIDFEWTFPAPYSRPLDSVEGGTAIGTVKIEGKEIPAYAVHHHLAHAAVAAVSSPLGAATVVSFDGGGDKDSFVILDFVDDRFTVQESFRINLGIIFGLSGQMLFGIERRTAAGKLMAYAALGQPREAHALALHDVIARQEAGPYEREDLWDVLRRALGVRQGEYEADSGVARDFAATLQSVFVETLLRVLDSVRRRKDLCLTGGCALNCVANTEVLNHTGSQPYVTPLPDDGAIAAGAALFVATQLWETRPACDAVPFVGRAYTFDGFEGVPRGVRATFIGDTLAEVLARRIAAGGIYGLIDGRSECGPRALGHRSLVADPRRKGVVGFLNSLVKGREWYRPFAPAVLAHRAEEVLAGPVNEFMSFSSQVKRPDWFPAVTHFDGSARGQNVLADRSSLLSSVLVAFEQHTGCPVLLNTSLNGQNEPICDAPEHALALLASKPINGIACDGWLVERSPLITVSL